MDEGFPFFDWFEVPALITGIEGQEDLAGEVHFYLAWTLVIVAAGHGLAAIKHHLIDKDDTLKRMIKNNDGVITLNALKKILAASALSAAAMGLSVPAMAADYAIDTKGAHAFINFKISHLGYSWLHGNFEDFSGSFTFDEKDPSKSKVEVTIKNRFS